MPAHHHNQHHNESPPARRKPGRRERLRRIKKLERAVAWTGVARLSIGDREGVNGSGQPIAPFRARFSCGRELLIGSAWARRSARGESGTIVRRGPIAGPLGTRGGRGKLRRRGGDTLGAAPRTAGEKLALAPVVAVERRRPRVPDAHATGPAPLQPEDARGGPRQVDLAIGDVG